MRAPKKNTSFTPQAQLWVLQCCLTHGMCSWKWEPLAWKLPKWSWTAPRSLCTGFFPPLTDAGEPGWGIWSLWGAARGWWEQEGVSAGPGGQGYTLATACSWKSGDRAHLHPLALWPQPNCLIFLNLSFPCCQREIVIFVMLTYPNYSWGQIK